MTRSEDIDRTDHVRHASEDARVKAIERMKRAQRGESDEEGAASSGQSGEDMGSEASASKSDSAILDMVKVYSPYKVYMEEAAHSISAVNATGPFDVLPGHKNFLTLLNACDIKVSTISRGAEKITIERGIMHVRNNRVTVFLDV